jgi:hypothetical protein
VPNLIREPRRIRYGQVAPVRGKGKKRRADKWHIRALATLYERVTLGVDHSDFIRSTRGNKRSIARGGEIERRLCERAEYSRRILAIYRKDN